MFDRKLDLQSAPSHLISHSTDLLRKMLGLAKLLQIWKIGVVDGNQMCDNIQFPVFYSYENLQVVSTLRCGVLEPEKISSL